MAIELITCGACGAKNASSRTVCLSCGADLEAAKERSEKEAVESPQQSLWERVKRIAKNLTIEQTGKGKLKRILAREWLVVVSGFLVCLILAWFVAVSWWFVAPRETTDPYTVFGENIFDEVYEVRTKTRAYTVTVPSDEARIIVRHGIGLQGYLEGLLKQSEPDFSIIELQLSSHKKISFGKFLGRSMGAVTALGSALLVLLYSLYLIIRSIVWCVRTIQRQEL